MSADPPSKSNPANNFQPVESLKEMIHLLSEAANSFSTATLWTKNQQVQIKSRMKAFDQAKRTLLFATPNPVELDQLKISLESQNTTQTFFCILHPRANLYFTAEFKGIQSIGLEFEVPKVMHKVQRRENVRYPIPSGKVMPLHFQDPVYPDKLIRKNILDISAGGLSFLTNTAESSLYVIGLTLEGLQFNMGGKKLTFSGQVRYAKTFTNAQDKPQLKVGVQFMNIKSADSSHIASFVNEEMRKYYMTLL